MKSNDAPAEFSAPGEVRLVRLLPGPIERVWEFLTDSEKRGRWLASGPLAPQAGGKVELHFAHHTLTPHQEKIPEAYAEMCAEDSAACSFTGRVTRYEPPHALAYTWQESNGSPSEVTFELAPQGDRVRLLLIHRRLGDDRGTLASVAAGWHAHVAILIAKLAGEPVPLFWSTHGQWETHYAGVLAAAGKPAAVSGVAAKLIVTSLCVDDQAKALVFYTEKLGFVKKTDFPVGEFRWLTVVAADATDGVELVFEPNVNPAAQAFQQALREQEIPATCFGVDDVADACVRLKSAGVRIVREPVRMGPVTVAVIDDTCGNLIQLAQKHAS